MRVAIITLDLINELCDPKGKLARYADRIEKNQIIEKINQLTEYGRAQQQALIAHVKLVFRKNYADCSSISPLFKAAAENNILSENSWGVAFSDKLTIADNDVVINKHRVSAFYGTDLELILRANQIDTLILTGIATNNAIELTAREAHDRDFRVIVASDATEGLNDTEKNASLNFLEKISDVKLTADIVQGDF